MKASMGKQSVISPSSGETLKTVRSRFLQTNDPGFSFTFYFLFDSRFLKTPNLTLKFQTEKYRREEEGQNNDDRVILTREIRYSDTEYDNNQTCVLSIQSPSLLFGDFIVLIHVLGIYVSGRRPCQGVSSLFWNSLSQSQCWSRRDPNTKWVRTQGMSEEEKKWREQNEKLKKNKNKEKS